MLFRPLDTGPARFFGAVSYSFYLLHLLGVSIAIRLLDPLGLYAGGMAISTVVVLTTLVAILLTAPVAWLSRRWIEVPAIAFGKGRVFHTALGHGLEAIKCVGFATTLQRGTEWAATGKVTQPAPASFPTETAALARP